MDTSLEQCGKKLLRKCLNLSLKLLLRKVELSSIVVKQKKKASVPIEIQRLFMLMAGFEPARREAGDFRTALCCQSRLRVAVWTMS